MYLNFTVNVLQDNYFYCDFDFKNEIYLFFSEEEKSGKGLVKL